MPSSRGSSQPRDQTRVSSLQGDSSPSEPPGKPLPSLEGEVLINHWASREPPVLQKTFGSKVKSIKPGAFREVLLPPCSAPN